MELFISAAAHNRRSFISDDGDEGGGGVPTRAHLTTTSLEAIQDALFTRVTHTTDPPGHPVIVGPPFTSFPSVPFLALDGGLEVLVSTRNDTSAVDVDRVHRIMQRVAREEGTVWCVGSASLHHDPAFRHISTTTASAAAAATRGGAQAGAKRGREKEAASMLRYDQYVTALLSAFSTMTTFQMQAAALDASLLCSHAFYARITGHPVYKDVMAMLYIERGSLMLFLSASSKVAQQYFSSAAQQVKADVPEWVAGATLCFSRPANAPHKPDALLTMWNALVHLPLSAVALPSSSTSTMPLEGVAPAGGEAVMESFAVSLVASFPLAAGGGGNEVHEASLRLAETQPVTLSEEERAEGEGAHRHPSSSRTVGCRYVWRLAGPVRVVHPRLLTHMVAALVEECQLSSFEIRCGERKELMDGAPTALLNRNFPQLGGSGFAYVHGASYGATDIPHSSSTPSSWIACSRLSSMAWILPSERRALGMITSDEEEDVEAEFRLSRVCFKDTITTTTEGGRPARQPAQPYPAGLLDTQHWPPCFQLWKSVVRVMEDTTPQDYQ